LADLFIKILPMCRGFFVVGLILLISGYQSHSQIPDSLNLDSVPPPSQQQDTRFPRDVLPSRPSDTANPSMLKDSVAGSIQNDTILTGEDASADTLVPKLISVSALASSPVRMVSF
jgi:cell division septation protein DedD